MLRAWFVVFGALLFLFLFHPPDVDARRSKTDDLMTVVSPSTKDPASAHPDVNVVVQFGATKKGAAADPSTFRARLGRDDVTSSFQPINGRTGVTGMRGTLPHDRLRVGGRRINRLRLLVETAASGSRGRRLRSIERVHFRAVEQPDRAPVAQLQTDATVIVPGVAFTFDATASYDPDNDVLTYHWDFGDGTTSSEQTVSHTFAANPPDGLRVQLTVSDGQMTSTAESDVLTKPDLPPGKTPGAIRIDAADALEFGAVAVGTTATRTLQVTNTDTTDTSWVSARVGVDTPGFSVDTPSVELAPGASATVTVSFAPTQGGHAGTRLAIIAAASNRESIVLLAHGYGGDAPGTGPTLAGLPVFYSESSIAQGGFAVRGFLPDGTPVSTDNGVRTCRYSTGPSYDVCMTDADCAPNGGTCPQTDTCLGGDRSGETCSTPNDCPSGLCPVYASFDPAEMCGDGAGGLFILSGEDTWTDPNPNDDTDVTVSVLGISLDAQANAVGKQILARTTSGTEHMSCDGLATGRVRLAEYHMIPDSVCPGTAEKESLVAIRKDNGNKQIELSRIDTAEGVDACGDLDNVAHLETSRDGTATYAAFEWTGAVWRVRPTPLQYLAPPPVGTDWREIPADGFRLLPDGSLAFVTVLNGATTAVMNVYRVTPGQVALDPVSLNNMSPCASFEVPNNGEGNSKGFAFVTAFAAAPSVPGGRDGTLLVSFSAGAGGLSSIVAPALTISGTAAVAMPADVPTCSVSAPLVNLKSLDQLTF